MATRHYLPISFAAVLLSAGGLFAASAMEVFFTWSNRIDYHADDSPLDMRWLNRPIDAEGFVSITGKR
jgi:hypothetical protein